MKKFKDGDIFVNSVKTYPKVKLFGYDGKIYINNTNETSVKLNDFLPEPPTLSPPPPTEAPTLFLTTGTTYLASGAGLSEPEYDIYPLDFSSAPPPNVFVGIDWDASIHSGTQVIFRREDINTLVNVQIFESGVPGYYSLPIGGSLTFISDGVTWVLQ